MNNPHIRYYLEQQQGRGLCSGGARGSQAMVRQAMVRQAMAWGACFVISQEEPC
jgi:hypothetical protein